MRVQVYRPDGKSGPGRLVETQLDVLEVAPAGLTLAEVTVRDESGQALFQGDDLRFDPAAGGGPLAGPGAQRQARAFAVVNSAFHAQRALRFAAVLLGRPLPHLLVRIGLHHEQRSWGGGHYRLPAQSYSELPEAGPVRPDGEMHLGYGRGFLSVPEPRYFHTPGHNPAIIYHEVGHHLCRHSADFRLNRLLPALAQTNRKIALDEGTSDYFAAVLLGTPDIYGWHRGQVPVWQQSRRCLNPRWTMASFHGGRERDPHSDGTVWASALWSARMAVQATGADPTRFDSMVVQGLDRFGSSDGDNRSEPVLRRRRHFSRLLAAIVATDASLAEPVLAAMAGHGIRLGASNAELRDQARARLTRRSAV